MPTKTLKQQLTDLLNKEYNDSHFDENDIINIFKEWLTQKRQEYGFHENVDNIFNRLLEELKNDL